MDVAAIFALIQKGLTVVGTLIQAGQSAGPALSALQNLVVGAQQGEVDDQMLIATEELLDKLIANFNEPMAD